MKTRQKLWAGILTALSLAGSPLHAQSPQTGEEIEIAPNVRNFKDLQKLDRQIVSLSERAQPATVCLIAKNGRGSGSGVVVSKDGLVLTAAHVTSGMKDGIIVLFPDGTRKAGKALGADYDRDAAMVQITDEGTYPFVELGSSASLKRNQWTIAMGHSGGFDPMRKPPVRLGRVLSNGPFVTTDTAVVGGDSGGPLFDVNGRVIGIHSNIGRTLMENRHVPVDVFKDQWEALKNGKISGSRFNSARQNTPSPDRPVLGVQLEQADDGIRIGEVVPQSPAEAAGLKAGDLIRSINDKEFETIEALVEFVGGMKPGKEVTIGYKRDGKDNTTKATLTTAGKMMGREERKEESAPKPKESKPASEDKADQDGPDEDEKNNAKVPSIEDLLKNAAQNGGRLELTPELMQKMGGMEKLMEELRKQAGLPMPMESDSFFESSLKALQPVMKKNPGSTVQIMVDGKPVALGTVVTPNGRILTKNTETKGGTLSVVLDGKSYEAAIVKRFPKRDLALLQIDADNLNPVRFQETEPPLGSVLTSSGVSNEPLGIGLLSVPGRAMAQVGFIGIQAGEADEGVLVVRVVPEGAAARAGIKENDILTKVDGKEIEDPISFGNLIRGRKAGEVVKVEYLRDGKTTSVEVTLKERAMRDNARNDPRMRRTMGELSEKTGGFPDAIQHDIPLPPMLCGGPLFNLRGKCIGINVSRAGRTKTYAIPADEILAILELEPERQVQIEPASEERNSNRETIEAIKAIRSSLKQIEKRLDELEKSTR